MLVEVVLAQNADDILNRQVKNYGLTYNLH